jgi:DNA-binding Lrp family transcriptional regulator
VKDGKINAWLLDTMTLRILSELMKGQPLAVTEMAERFGMIPNNLYRRLRKLESANLIESTGKRHHCGDRLRIGTPSRLYAAKLRSVIIKATRDGVLFELHFLDGLSQTLMVSGNPC